MYKIMHKIISSEPIAPISLSLDSMFIIKECCHIFNFGFAYKDINIFYQMIIFGITGIQNVISPNPARYFIQFARILYFYILNDSC